MQVMGVTDVDDKIINRAADQGLTGTRHRFRCLAPACHACVPLAVAEETGRAGGRAGVAGARELAHRFEAEFLHDLRDLHVLPPDALTRVSDFIPDIVRCARAARTARASRTARPALEPGVRAQVYRGPAARRLRVRGGAVGHGLVRRRGLRRPLRRARAQPRPPLRPRTRPAAFPARGAAPHS